MADYAIKILRKLRDEDYQQFENRVNETLGSMRKRFDVEEVTAVETEKLLTFIIRYERSRNRSNSEGSNKGNQKE